MNDSKLKFYLQNLLENLPKDWVELTTHRLDIYHEEKAKAEFIEEFEKLFQKNISEADSLSQLPTAYDYIRLGHPLSSVLEWSIAKILELSADAVISFSSQSMPLYAVLRANLLEDKKTRIVYAQELPKGFDQKNLEGVYGYRFELVEANDPAQLSEYEGSTVLIQKSESIEEIHLNEQIDFCINLYPGLGSIIIANGDQNQDYISKIQHVRRRESIAMTPANCKKLLEQIVGGSRSVEDSNLQENQRKVKELIRSITEASAEAVIGSSGLSVQYAIMMGLVDEAMSKYPGKEIKFIVPTNCYGGTNDQARRVADAIDLVEVVDLEVDGDHDMVEGIERILNDLAEQDTVPYIIAEIPTNPRVEVPNRLALKTALEKKRKTQKGEAAVGPVFILDQTFCPNVHFLGEGRTLSDVPTIAYVSGSKFPSGGKCTAGYCTANSKASSLMEKIENHIQLCDNQATPLQMEILAEQMPSILYRIHKAYQNTREFVNFIQETLPSAKINFVSEDLAKEGFTPSVFSLDLPTKGSTEEEREEYKRQLNLKLIDRMIKEIPAESKYCVSYGQLKGCYWTIPATSTQGTTKEEHKDYIARVSVSPNLDLEKHKQVFKQFVEEEMC